MPVRHTWINRYKYPLCFLSVGIVYFCNMFIDVMDVDAAQYASISREMLDNGSFLQVYHRGEDYLDKPPLLFWLSALSFFLFGISNFAYKLPAVLFLIVGIYSVYRFTLHWYDKKRALTASLILATTQAYLLMTNDIRTDGIFTGLVFFSIWQFSVFLKKNTWLPLFLGAVGVAGALMAKGPLAIIIVGVALGADLILKQKWKKIINPKWLIAILVIVVLIAPMSYGLYTQFDLHPEKEVYGLKGPSGLKFFFWTQSFGRITGENYWRDDSSFFYFFETILWDFQPWVLFLIPALYMRFRKLIYTKLKGPDDKEYITFFGFLIPFLALSLSHYKLPHYIFPLFPFMSIMIADYMLALSEGKKQKAFTYLKNIQFGLLHLLFAILFISFIFIFRPSSFILPLLIFVLFLFCWIVFRQTQQRTEQIILPTIILSFAFGLVTSTHFYPRLLQYQSHSVVGKKITEQNIPMDQFYFYKTHANSLEFYAERIAPHADINQMGAYPKGTLIYTNEEGKNEIFRQHQEHYKVKESYKRYHVTLLSKEFLLEHSRNDVLINMYLLEKTSLH